MPPSVVGTAVEICGWEGNQPSFQGENWKRGPSREDSQRNDVICNKYYW